MAFQHVWHVCYMHDRLLITQVYIRSSLYFQFTSHSHDQNMQTPHRKVPAPPNLGIEHRNL